MKNIKVALLPSAVALSILMLGACSDSDNNNSSGEAQIPQLAAATPATRTASCEDLANSFSFDNTTITSRNRRGRYPDRRWTGYC